MEFKTTIPLPYTFRWFPIRFFRKGVFWGVIFVLFVFRVFFFFGQDLYISKNLKNCKTSEVVSLRVRNGTMNSKSQSCPSPFNLFWSKNSKVLIISTLKFSVSHAGITYESSRKDFLLNHGNIYYQSKHIKYRMPLYIKSHSVIPERL